MEPNGSGKGNGELPPPPPDVEPVYDGVILRGDEYKNAYIPGAPYQSHWARDADNYSYEFTPVAPSKFPPPPDHNTMEVVVPDEEIRHKPHWSIFALLGTAFFLAAFATVTALAALSCNTLDWCRTDDFSPTSDEYIFNSFPWLIPTEWILGALAVGLFGLATVCFYAVLVIRQDCGTPRMAQIAGYIQLGSRSFLIAEYTPLSVLVLGIMLLLILLFHWRLGVCYVIGAVLSGLTGAIGMSIATEGNVRTTAASERSLSAGLNVAFRTGAVMGLSVVSVGICGLSVCYLAFSDVRALAGFSAGASTIALFARVGGGIYTKAADVGADLVGKVEASIPEDDPRNPATIADNVGDNVGDVAGMGADLFESFVGSIVATVILGASLPYFFDNPFAMCVYNHLNIDLECGTRSPANNNGVLIDNAAQKSFANEICAENDFYLTYPSLNRISSQGLFVLLPFALAMVGIGASIVCSGYLFVRGGDTKDKADIMEELLNALRRNTMAAGVLIICAAFGLTFGLFGPNSNFLANPGFGEPDLLYYNLQSADRICAPRLDRPSLPNGAFAPGYYRPYDPIGFHYPPPISVWWRLYLCIIIGLGLGIVIGWLTELFTSGHKAPTKRIAASGEYGAGAVVITGLGWGLLSVVAPLLLVFATILGTYALFSSYGIALAAVGMLSTLGVTMATDAYGPVADNAGGIAEMAELPSHVRDTTDALDALGNTTAAVGKGFSNGSAVLTAYALLTALVQDSGLVGGPASIVGSPPGAVPVKFVFNTDIVDLVNIYVITSLLLGIMLPFAFGALTMLAVSRAAQAMIVEVRRQFRDIPGLREGRPGVRPDHQKCITISTVSSLLEMVLPGFVAIMSPLIIGFGFGQRALVGLLLGAIGSGYMLGIMMSNAGGAWDNAKKLVESGAYGKANAKGSEWHKATVAGDTVGDPFKDTSGPSMNILIKMMTVFGLVFVPKMEVALKNGWIGLILLGAAIVSGGVFILIASLFRTNKMAEEARKPPPSKEAEQPVAPPAQSPYIAPGPGLNVRNMPRSSALYDAYKTAGGQSGAVAGNTIDVFNLPGLGYGTKEPLAAPEAYDEPDLARARGPQFDPRTIVDDEVLNAPPPLNKKDD